MNKFFYIFLLMSYSIMSMNLKRIPFHHIRHAQLQREGDILISSDQLESKFEQSYPITHEIIKPCIEKINADLKSKNIFATYSINEGDGNAALQIFAKYTDSKEAPVKIHTINMPIQNETTYSNSVIKFLISKRFDQIKDKINSVKKYLDGLTNDKLEAIIEKKKDTWDFLFHFQIIPNIIIAGAEQIGFDLGKSLFGGLKEYQKNKFPDAAQKEINNKIAGLQKLAQNFTDNRNLMSFAYHLEDISLQVKNKTFTSEELNANQKLYCHLFEQII